MKALSTPSLLLLAHMAANNGRLPIGAHPGQLRLMKNALYQRGLIDYASDTSDALVVTEAGHAELEHLGAS